MLRVFITVDTEVWPYTADWRESCLSRDLRRDIEGVTRAGDYGVPFQLDLLDAHGLKAVFFVESLFASVVGLDPLHSIVSMIRERGHGVDLHLHPEWLSRMARPLVPLRRSENMKDFSEDEQALLIAEGLRNLRACGADDVCAFRAGNYGANFATLRALARNGLRIDSSHNSCYLTSRCDMPTPRPLLQPERLHGVTEFPISFFCDWPGHYRHAQLCACSWKELENALWEAWRQGWYSFVIVSHSFELIRDRLPATRPPTPDWTVIGRFRRLCQFLDQHRDKFQTCRFQDVDVDEIPASPSPSLLHSRLHYTGERLVEQFLRKIYY